MRKLIGLVAGVAMVFALALPVAATDKVTICHATSSAGNPFVAIKVAANSGYEPHLSDNPQQPPALQGHEQDFLLENTELETCDQVADVATPLAPSVSDATCEAAGTLTLTAVDGITYSIEPAFTWRLRRLHRDRDSRRRLDHCRGCADCVRGQRPSGVGLP